MPKKIFISHANADLQFAEQFVSDVIQLGCGVQPDDLFYSSGADTGIPDGADLMAHVREEVGAATLVVALITPMYLSRPVCMAELGAAWGVATAGKLFPLLAPGMKRKDLDGILPSLLIRYINDRDALDALHDRVGEVMGTASKAATWGRHVIKWLAAVDERSATLERPQVASIDEMESLGRQLDEAKTVVVEQEGEIADLQERLEAIAKLKNQAAVAQILLPKDQRKRFETLVASASKLLDKVNPPIVREAIRCEAVGIEFSWPDAYDDLWTSRDAQEAYDDGYLIDGHAEGTLVPDSQFRSYRLARDAVEKLMKFIDDEAEPELHEYFEAAHGMPLDLRKRPVWDELLS